MKVYTIGHYNHSKEQFITFLKAAEISFVADVRAFPASRNNSHFKKENMAQWLREAGIHYRHFPGLGGRRKLSGQIGEKLNEGWNNRSFHNYADYTLTKDFQYALEQLKEQAKESNLVYMCSEHHPARCHRLLISNWLQANGWDVLHLIPDSEGNPEIVLMTWGSGEPCQSSKKMGPSCTRNFKNGKRRIFFFLLRFGGSRLDGTASKSILTQRSVKLMLKEPYH